MTLKSPEQHIVIIILITLLLIIIGHSHIGVGVVRGNFGSPLIVSQRLFGHTVSEIDIAGIHIVFRFIRKLLNQLVVLTCRTLYIIEIEPDILLRLGNFLIVAYQNLNLVVGFDNILILFIVQIGLTQRDKILLVGGLKFTNLLPQLG